LWKPTAGPAASWSATAPKRPGCWSSTPTATLRLQRACVQLLGHALRRPGRRHHHAYLTDRVPLAEGNQDRYGTQIMLLGGTWQSRPLADPQHVDDRRRQIGPEPLAD
jgi:hypothetical protein